MDEVGWRGGGARRCGGWVGGETLFSGPRPLRTGRKSVPSRPWQNSAVEWRREEKKKKDLKKNSVTHMAQGSAARGWAEGVKARGVEGGHGAYLINKQ